MSMLALLAAATMAVGSDGSNPIVKTRFTPDPAGVVDGDWFYLFTGHDEPDARGYKMKDWQVFGTTNMTDWVDFGAVMDTSVFKWAVQGNRAWASQAIKRGNKWYWYCAVAGAGQYSRHDCIGVAVADTVEGPWTDPIGKPLLCGRAGYIDPSVFIDDDGKAYLFWGNCGGDPGAWYAELKESMVELAGEVKVVPGLMDESAFGKPLKKKRGAGARKPIDTNFEEAPWIYKVGDTYYLEYAAGGVPEYWAYSTAKSIHGPWTYGGRIMDEAEGTGTIHGGSVFFKGEWYMVYHNATLPGGADCRRSACIEKYVRNPDGTIPFIPATKTGVSRQEPPAVVKVSPDQKGVDVSRKLWGIFFEDISWAADGGLNPELLANPGFDWQQRDHEKWNTVIDGWEPDYRDGGMARLSFQFGAPVHPNTAKHLRIESFGAGLAGVRNNGLDGLRMRKGEPYRLQYDVRELTAQEGIDWVLPKWNRKTLEFTFEGTRTIEADGFVLEIAERSFSILVKGRRVFEFDNMSLLPTGPNLVRAGMRKDLVDRLAALKPSFVRFPGGCVVEEGDFQHWYDWRRTVGPKERRECIWNRWGRPERPDEGKGAPYWETFGIGYYEYFLLCEELGAEPLPICLSGLTCQFQRPDLRADVSDMDYFANVICDLIEFANGDVTTKWGKVRADMGHPKPFNLKMVGVGNENWDLQFFERCEPICRIVRQKHPEIEIVGSSGPGPDGKSFDFAWNRITKETADVVDEHYYRDPNWFLNSFHRYDKYDRIGKPGVYAGEYACHHRIGKAKPNTQWSAVCEAVAMCGFERNSDVVKMASYAPLFAREGHDQWSPNLIWFDGERSLGTPNYYIQQLFSLNRPDYTVKSEVTGDDLYEVCGIDTAKNELIVKLVNTAEKSRVVTIDFGKALAATDVTFIRQWANRNDINTQERPLWVAPRTTRVRHVGGNTLTVDLDPTSVNVVRIPYGAR